MNFRIFALWCIISITFSIISREHRQERWDKQAHEALVAMAAADPVPKTVTLYQDSLNTYFGKLEQDLIIQYKSNFEGLRTDNDFDYFFTNATTLRATLTQSLQRYAEEDAEIEQVYELPWLEELLPGLKVKIVDDGKKWLLHPDYLVYLQRANQTKGLADEEYFKLMISCYEPQTQFPTWLKKVDPSHGKFCTRLGGGTHLSLFRQLHRVDSAGNSFNNQTRKVRQMLVSDLLFAKSYCESTQKVLEEIKSIQKEIEFEDKEKSLLEKRIIALGSY